MLYIILAGARDHLKVGGRLYVVTIAGLRKFIKRNLTEVFGNYRKLKQGKTYTVGEAVKVRVASGGEAAGHDALAPRGHRAT